VVNQQTGRMWVRDVLRLGATGGVGGDMAFDRPLTWAEALSAVADLDYAGYDDWRLPNLRELSTLVDFGRFGPTLDPAAFPEDFSRLPGPYFWTATTSPIDASQAYYVNFLDGHFYPWPKDTRFLVRPVRDVAVADPVALIQTGQTVGYGPDDRPGPGHGDDGDLRRGLSPDYRWSDDGRVDTAPENVALDAHTALTWLRDPTRLDGGGGVGGGVGGNVDLRAPLDWQAAVTACNALDYAGADDWRLPNIRELESITLPGQPGSPVDPAAFPGSPVSPDPGQPYAWWSSTTAALPRPGQPAGGLAWYITTAAPVMRHVVAEGFTPAKSRRHYVRCVRDTTPPIRPALYAPEVRSSADFSDLTIAPAGRPGEREGKFLLALPTTADAPFAAAYQDVNAHPLHYDFLRAAFPEAFAGLAPDDYTALVARRATRRYVAGGLRRFAGAGGESVHGFDVYVTAGEPGELLTVEETRAVYRRLAQTFRRRPFAYAPVSPEAMALARSWENPLPTRLPPCPWTSRPTRPASPTAPCGCCAWRSWPTSWRPAGSAARTWWCWTGRPPTWTSWWVASSPATARASYRT
jgi:hypothetical protein